MRPWLRTTIDYVSELIRVILISLAIILPVRYFLIQPFYVKGASMEPNFYDHEYLIIDEISYRFKEPARGEVVVFRYPFDPSQFYIKRIIGLPGETVEIKEGKVYILQNDALTETRLEEPYLLLTITPGEQRTKLSEDEYFVLGDNRLASLDSRQFGPVKRLHIIGRTWLRGWPFNKIEIFYAPGYNINNTNE